MKEYATQFYSSSAWQACRKAYAKSKGGLCEKCLLKGLYTPGEIVHHKIHLTPENIELPEVTLNWNNLELVCRECHAVEHGARERRYEVLPDGRVAPL